MKTFKIFSVVAILIIVSAFAINTVVPFSQAERGGYNVGDVAQDFSLKNVNNEMVSLSDYDEAKGFVVVFTCNTCPFSIANENRLIAIDKKYKKLGYPVIAINPNNPAVKEGESFSEMKQRAKNKNFTFPYLVDEGQEIYPKYGALKTPHVYVLQKSAKGNIVKYIGAIDDSSRDESSVDEQFLANALDELLAGKEVTIKETKAIGCSIKA